MSTQECEAHGFIGCRDPECYTPPPPPPAPKGFRRGLGAVPADDRPVPKSGVVIAQFYGTCVTCENTIHEGDEIIAVDEKTKYIQGRPVKVKGWRHVGCPA